MAASTLSHLSCRIRAIAVALASLSLLSLGCCGGKYPEANPVAGASGAYVRVLPGDMRAGMAVAPGSNGGWPPLPSPTTPCTNERDTLAASLHVTAKACPNVEKAPVPVVVAADDDKPLPPGGFGLRCYELGEAVLVVETMDGAGQCNHVVGLAVFPRSNP